MKLSETLFLNPLVADIRKVTIEHPFNRELADGTLRLDRFQGMISKFELRFHLAERPQILSCGGCVRNTKGRGSTFVC